MRFASLVCLLLGTGLAAADEVSFSSPVVNAVRRSAQLPCTCANRTLDCSERDKEELLAEDRCEGSVTTLNLFGNSFSSFPDGFTDATTVNVSSNQLYSMPQPSQLSLQLRVLDLSRNSMQTPGTEIRTLAALETLNIRENHFIRNLNFLPNPCGLRRLDASHNNIRNFDDSLLSCSRLEELILDSNMITSIPESSFANLTGLKILDLSRNALMELSPLTFAPLTHLRRLNLERSNLQILPEGVFSSLVELEHLNLQENLLTLLPVTVFSSLNNLVYLNLASNRFTSYPYAAMNNIRSLQVLDLSSNGISNLNFTAHNTLPLLKEFYLHSNNITQLPAGTFLAWRHLEVLTLNENPLSSMPNRMMHQEAQLKRVAVTLDAINGENFDKISKVTHLEWSSHSPVALPSRAFALLTRLKSLAIGRNSIASMASDAFGGLQLLEALSLGSNNITQLQPGIFSRLPRLAHIQLWNNLLTTLPEELFSGMNRLEVLNLHNNRISVLPQGVFAGLSNLKKLDLAHNKLTTLPPHLFVGLRSLQELNVENNKLTTLPPLSTSCVSLRAVSFDGNPIHEINQTTANSWMGSGEKERYVSVEGMPGIRAETLLWVLDAPGLTLASNLDCSCGSVRRGQALLRLCVAINCAAKILGAPSDWIEGVRFSRHN